MEERMEKQILNLKQTLARQIVAAAEFMRSEIREGVRSMAPRRARQAARPAKQDGPSAGPNK